MLAFNKHFLLWFMSLLLMPIPRNDISEIYQVQWRLRQASMITEANMAVSEPALFPPGAPSHIPPELPPTFPTALVYSGQIIDLGYPSLLGVACTAGLMLGFLLPEFCHG